MRQSPIPLRSGVASPASARAMSLLEAAHPSIDSIADAEPYNHGLRRRISDSHHGGHHAHPETIDLALTKSDLPSVTAQQIGSRPPSMGNHVRGALLSTPITPSSVSGPPIALDAYGKLQIQSLHEELHLMQSRLNNLMTCQTLPSSAETNTTAAASTSGKEKLQKARHKRALSHVFSPWTKKN